MQDAEFIPSAQRLGFASLFEAVRPMRTCIDSVLEGRCGSLIVDTAAESGTAWILAPPFWLAAGPCDSAAARSLAETIEQFGGVVVADEDWLAAIEARCPDRTDRVSRTSFETSGLDRARLQGLATPRLPGLEVVRLDAELLSAACARISPDLLFSTSFGSAAAFERDGIGFCVLSDAQLVAAAASAFVSANAIEVQVNTRPDQRGRGLATLASAALLVSCLDNGLRPNWDTGNPVSQRLAERLGYTPLPAYEMLEVAPRA